ncbi:MAG: Stp1/IreP family PP2C-type Ser/Thr phosphatase [Clostridia bacterium]|nr:Stp1/IreP family PP2C-type Ser/Thr phosphatase [Clostridia bacterium]
MKIVGKSDIGKVRVTNQDSFKIVKINKLYLCVVCDGMGGVAGGSTASNAASEEFVCSMALKINKAGQSGSDYEKMLIESVDAANKKVYEMSGENAELSGMGTTLCALLTDGKKVWASSVGDSRIYAFAKGGIYQVSHDHSYVQALIDNGTITADESKTHPNKNIITRAVGTQPTVECDTFVFDFDASGYLICSDGLTNYISDGELNEIFLQNNEAEEVADEYIRRANEKGGGDNITVIVIKK